MAPYDFKAPDTNAILRASDGKEFHVHRLILNLSSPVFQGMFALLQSTDNPSPHTPIIDVSDPSDVLEPFIQYLYLQSPPKITDLTMWTALYTIADKYNTEAVMKPLRDMLIPRFLETSPLHVYALASRWGFEEEAKIASRRTLTMDIFRDFPREYAELMGGGACQQLYLLHFNRREAARALVENHPPPHTDDPTCRRLPLNSALCSALCERLSTRPWLTGEELCEDIVIGDYPWKCGPNCRHAIRYIYAYLTSLLQAISDLPQTI